MDSVLEGSEQLGRGLTAERTIGPAIGSLVLHFALACSAITYAWMLGLFHHNLWGSTGTGGAMQVNLVSSALPLPSQQINKNVLTTETPSQAPATPSPKEQKHEDETAIPIAGKQVKPKPQTTPKTQQHQPQPQQNVAQYGEQAGSVMPRAVQQPGTVGQTTVGDNGFANMFPYYVEGINRKMNETWNKFEVDSHTPKGARVFLIFTIHRDGSVSNIQLDRSSGSPTLDRSCQRGVQRVDTFGPLPSQYNQSTLQVEYFCEY